MMGKAMISSVSVSIRRRLSLGGYCYGQTRSVGLPHDSGCFTFQLRCAVSEAAALKIAENGDDGHANDVKGTVHQTSTTKTTTSMSPSNTKHGDNQDDIRSVLHASNEPSMPDYIACTIPHPSDQPLYRTPAIDLFDGRESRPVEGGNWNPEAPLEWTQTFGRRSVEMAAKLAPLVKLRPGDEGYFDVSGLKLPGFTIVRRDPQHRIKWIHVFFL